MAGPSKRFGNVNLQRLRIESDDTTVGITLDALSDGHIFHSGMAYFESATFSGDIDASSGEMKCKDVEIISGGELTISGSIDLPETPHVFAYLPSASVTNCTDSDTFYAIQGAFTNNPIKDFSVDAGKLRYDGDATKYFEVIWSATIETDKTTNIVHIGISKNLETLIILSPSVMATQCKNAGQEYALSGLFVLQLQKNDNVQLQIASSVAVAAVTVNHFTTSIKQFL